ncbi:MAG: Dabb family protein [Bacteroidota bacterium]
MGQNSSLIRHTVVFRLTFQKDSTEARDFLHAAKKLAAIPGVEHFECLQQVSKKNKFDFGLSMEFANQDLYDNYSNHPDHIAFIEKYWLK